MRIGVLGTGNMGQALIKGIVNSSKKSVEIIAYDKSPQALKNLPRGVKTISPDKWTGSAFPQVIIIAVKPNDVADSLASLKTGSSKPPLWISIAAGVALTKLQSMLPGGARVCRVMPNTPALIGEGMSAYSLNDACTQSDAKLTEEILKSVGLALRVPEKLMNAITGLSGSGPAYVYLFIESLIEGGVTAGLPLPIARQCAIQTVIGASKLLQQSPETPAELKSRVMSPAGTTARGLMALEKGRFKYAVIKAVTSAAARAEELGG